MIEVVSIYTRGPGLGRGVGARNGLGRGCRPFGWVVTLPANGSHSAAVRSSQQLGGRLDCAVGKPAGAVSATGSPRAVSMELEGLLAVSTALFAHRVKQARRVR